jgi:hypothetical protein
MDWRAFWTKKLAQAEREVDAARTRTALNASTEAMQTGIPPQPERPRLRVVGDDDAASPLCHSLNEF